VTAAKAVRFARSGLTAKGRAETLSAPSRKRAQPQGTGAAHAAGFIEIDLWLYEEGRMTNGT
jgi:hypothetical protein